MTKKAGRKFVKELRGLNTPLEHRQLDGKSVGYGLRGIDGFGHGAVVANMPKDSAGAAQSVCGLKTFLIDEGRRFKHKNGRLGEVVRCASVGVLEIGDSPVHVHSKTIETYIILRGTGLMVLGDKVVNVTKGDVVLIPPGVRHGLMSTQRRPVRVLMTFTPGLAPMDVAEHRDERVLADKTSEFIQENRQLS